MNVLEFQLHHYNLYVCISKIKKSINGFGKVIIQLQQQQQQIRLAICFAFKAISLQGSLSKSDT